MTAADRCVCCWNSCCFSSDHWKKNIKIPWLAAPLCPSKFYNRKVKYIKKCSILLLSCSHCGITKYLTNYRQPTGTSESCLAEWVHGSGTASPAARAVEFPNVGILYSQSCQANTHLPLGTGHLRAGRSSRCPQKELCLKDTILSLTILSLPFLVSFGNSSSEVLNLSQTSSGSGYLRCIQATETQLAEINVKLPQIPLCFSMQSFFSP